MTLKWEEGNLLQIRTDVICHQCNCKTSHSKGLAQAIFSAFPSCDVYRSIAPRDRKVGTCVLTTPTENPESLPFKRIAHLFAQESPGKCRAVLCWKQERKMVGQSPLEEETPLKREEWFASALRHLDHSVSPTATIAFPYLIGCGLAGGNWPRYLKILMEFASRRRGDVFIITKSTTP